MHWVEARHDQTDASRSSSGRLPKPACTLLPSARIRRSCRMICNSSHRALATTTQCLTAIPKPQTDRIQQQTLARQMAESANSNGIELSLQDLRPAIPDRRQSQAGEAVKPATGKLKLQLVPHPIQAPSTSPEGVWSKSSGSWQTRGTEL